MAEDVVALVHDREADRTMERATVVAKGRIDIVLALRTLVRHQLLAERVDGRDKGAWSAAGQIDTCKQPILVQPSHVSLPIQLAAKLLEHVPLQTAGMRFLSVYWVNA